jgi:UDP-3-O-[3-hydroxymyristoyl] N-acetylglucosamine deacetylase
MQTTLKQTVTISGVGLHSGKMMTMHIHPAPADHGIVFVRSDLSGQDNVIPARWDAVVDTQLCTVISNKDGASVGTIEHVMSALCGCGVDNALIDLDGPEVPVMDGSAVVFVETFDQVGFEIQDAARKTIRILKEVTVEKDGKVVTLSPADTASYGGTIEFSHPEIGAQHYEIQMLNGNFRHEIADARTFGFKQDVEYLRKNGLALGGSLDNAIVLDDTSILNPTGLRYKDEFIRHKLLDAIGDLYLAGAPLQGAYTGYKAGHEMNNAILHALFADQSAWEMVSS